MTKPACFHTEDLASNCVDFSLEKIKRYLPPGCEKKRGMFVTAETTLLFTDSLSSGESQYLGNMENWMNSKAKYFRGCYFDFFVLVEKPANRSQPKVDSIPMVVDLLHLGSEKDQDQR